MTPRINVEDSLRSFLAEDVGYGDITTDAIINPKQQGRGQVICKEDAVIAGLDEALSLLKIVNCKGKLAVRDGTKVSAGTTVLVATGPASELLKVERTLLNIVSHMSGIATITAEMVSKVREVRFGKVRIAATRKTLPGLRMFEKKAVQLGGGDTHRLGLDDTVLIKDNHLALGGSLSETIQAAKKNTSFTKKIEVEVTKPNDAVTAARSGADIILLDNMNVKNVRETVERLETLKLREKVLLEASGGIQKGNVLDYARTGVDIISMGAITHSAKSIDISMKITKIS